MPHVTVFAMYLGSDWISLGASTILQKIPGAWWVTAVPKLQGMMDGVVILQLNIPHPVPLLEYFLHTYVLGPIVTKTNPAVVRRTTPLFPPNL